MSVYRHIIPATEESFVLRPWGGRMCFLGTPKLVNCSKLTDAAICRIRQGQCHDGHTHGDTTMNFLSRFIRETCST